MHMRLFTKDRRATNIAFVAIFNLMIFCAFTWMSVRLNLHKIEMLFLFLQKSKKSSITENKIVNHVRLLYLHSQRVS